MPSIVDFNSLGGRAEKAKKRAEGNGSGLTYMRINGEATVRPLGHCFQVAKIFVKTKNGTRSVVVEPEDADKAAAMISEKVGYTVTPTTRYVMNVIDRDDKNIKVLEGGIKIFGVMGSWHKTTKIHPGSKDGWDWKIQKSGADLNTDYTTFPVEPKPITKDEHDAIKAKKKEYTLEERYSSTPIEEVMEVIFGDRSAGKESKPGSAQPAPVAVESGGSDITDADIW